MENLSIIAQGDQIIINGTLIRAPRTCAQPAIAVLQILALAEGDREAADKMLAELVQCYRSENIRLAYSGRAAA